MSDLISRRETVSELEEMCTNGTLTVGEQNLIKDIIGRIEKQPTAYDVEKVIMNLRCDTNCPNCSPNCVDAGICGFDEMLKQAIEIVRKGGVK